jgi:hypothetical protein
MTLEHNLLQLARDAMRSLMNGREFAVGQTGHYLNIISRIEAELSRSEKTQQWGNPKYLIEEAVLAEREACAKLCLELVQAKASGESYEDGTIDCASAIRARSEPNPAFKNYMGDNWAGIV